MKELIQLESKTPQLYHCACCDGASQEVTTFYKELQPDNTLSFNTYLTCCQEKVGKVVDWYSWEEYNKVTGNFSFGGYKVNKIKGYVK